MSNEKKITELKKKLESETDLTKQMSIQQEIESLEKGTEIMTEKKQEKKIITTWQQALMALPEKFTQLKIEEHRATVELGFAMQIIKNNGALQKCSASSIYDAIIYSARIGITLNPAFGMSYLVPRGNKCCLDVGYKGWSAILKSYGAVQNIDAYIVYADEDFEFNPAENTLHHKIKFAKTEEENKKREIVCAYSRAILPSGIIVFEVIPAWELAKIKKVSPAASSGFSPYKEWEGEMTRKAPIKRHAKKLLELQTDERVKALFAAEKENDDQPKKKQIAETWEIEAEEVISE